MRQAVIVTLSALALALPSADAWAASQPTRAAKKKVTIAVKSFTGTPGSADRWGEVQVVATIRRTTTTVGTKKTVKRRIVSIKIPLYPSHTDRSIYINQQALPYLVQEALQAQSANIDIVSGATFSSQGFAYSLQDALTQARKW